MAALDVTGWSFGRFADEIGTRFADDTAFIASNHRDGVPTRQSMTYAQMMQEVHALQWGLQDLGVVPGDRVGVMLSSFPEWILYLFAITRMGCGFMPISTRFRARELRHVLEHSGAAALVAIGHYHGTDYREIVQGARTQSVDGQPQALTALRHVIGVGTAPAEDAVDTQALLARGRILLAQHGVPPRQDDASTLAVLFYTSGTTSFPKGVPLTHANLLPHSVAAGALIDLRRAERVLSLYPFYGISGGANKVLSTFGSGACLVFQDAWRAGEASELLDTLDCRVVHGVDVQIRELLALREKQGAEVSPPARRGTIAFMASLDVDLARAMGQKLGLTQFIHPYGMTETNPMILRNTLDDAFEDSVRPGGRPAPGVDVRVVHPDNGDDAAPGTPGEIVVRGSTVMAGYYNDAATTAQSMLDGWFRTGDQGVRDERGFVFYLGRLKDMLKVGGFNVSPAEIEGVIRQINGVIDVAVTGQSDARLGEVPVAFVLAQPDAGLGAAAVIARCKAQIANFKVPKQVYFVESLPYHTAANGSKLQRQVLRQWAAERAS